MPVEEIQERVETLSLLIRQAKLYALAANIAVTNAGKARQRVLRANDLVFQAVLDCLACEAHKDVTGAGDLFVAEVQDHFTAVSEILESHMPEVSETAAVRRSLLGRLVPFARRIENGDFSGRANEQAMADAANEIEGRRQLYKFLFFGSKACGGQVPGYSGGPEKEFTPGQARDLVTEIVALRAALNAHMGEFKRIFSHPKLDRVLIDHRTMVCEIQDITRRLEMKPKTNAIPVRSVDWMNKVA